MIMSLESFNKTSVLQGRGHTQRRPGATWRQLQERRVPIKARVMNQSGEGRQGAVMGNSDSGSQRGEL